MTPQKRTNDAMCKGIRQGAPAQPSDPASPPQKARGDTGPDSRSKREPQLAFASRASRDCSSGIKAALAAPDLNAGARDKAATPAGLARTQIAEVAAVKRRQFEAEGLKPKPSSRSMGLAASS